MACSGRGSEFASLADAEQLVAIAREHVPAGKNGAGAGACGHAVAADKGRVACRFEDNALALVGIEEQVFSGKC